jgi:uncharacterized protein
VSKTALDLTAEEKVLYQPVQAIERRQKQTGEMMQTRWDQMQQLAQLAAQILKEEYGAKRVVLFGSGIQPTALTQWSDIDLAAWGLPAQRYFAAVAAVTSLSEEFRIDLIDPESCSQSLLMTIERDGIDL